MAGISSSTLGFLRDVRLNNNRPWFEENKPRYLAVKEELESLGQELLFGLAQFDESLRDGEMKPYVFRIYRDARFAKGRPYKSNLGILLVKGGKPAMHERAGYYVHIEPNSSFLVGGAYMPPAEWLTAIRQKLETSAGDFRNILNATSFKKYFSFEGQELKTAPRGYAKDHPNIDLLRKKSFIAIHRMSDSQVLSSDFSKHAIRAFKALKPFDDFLNSVRIM